MSLGGRAALGWYCLCFYSNRCNILFADVPKDADDADGDRVSRWAEIFLRTDS